MLFMRERSDFLASSLSKGCLSFLWKKLVLARVWAGWDNRPLQLLVHTSNVEESKFLVRMNAMEHPVLPVVRIRNTTSSSRITKKKRTFMKLYTQKLKLHLA